jgi:hypothetical protein
MDCRSCITTTPGRRPAVWPDEWLCPAAAEVRQMGRRGVSKVSISTLATAISTIAIAANGRSECHGLVPPCAEGRPARRGGLLLAAPQQHVPGVLAITRRR